MNEQEISKDMQIVKRLLVYKYGFKGDSAPMDLMDEAYKEYKAIKALIEPKTIMGVDFGRGKDKTVYSVVPAPQPTDEALAKAIWPLMNANPQEVYTHDMVAKAMLELKAAIKDAGYITRDEVVAMIEGAPNPFPKGGQKWNGFETARQRMVARQALINKIKE